MDGKGPAPGHDGRCHGTRRSISRLLSFHAEGRTGPAARRPGQRRAAAPTGGRSRRRRLRHSPWHRRRPSPCLRSLLSLGTLWLRRRCHAPFRHPRQSGVHSPQAGGPEQQRLARRPGGGHPSSLCLLHRRRGRGSHCQAALLCHPPVAPHAAVHGEQRKRHLQGTQHSHPAIQRPALCRRPIRHRQSRPESQAAHGETRHPPRTASGLHPVKALHGAGNSPHRDFRRGTGQRKGDGRTLYPG